MASIVVTPSSRLQGTLMPPGDKSLSHRAVMFASLAEGESRFENFLQAEDCLSTVNAFRGMGIKIDISPEGAVCVSGKGMKGLSQPAKELYLGNSGTTTRLLLGILSGQGFIATLTGDDSLSKRPMKRVTDPLREMGAKIQGPEDANFMPLTIKGGDLKAIRFNNELSSAQVKSAILLAGLYAEGETRVKENRPSRDHTERMLRLFGADCRSKAKEAAVRKTAALKPQTFRIPSDISSAAFFIVAAALVPGSEILIRNVCLNPTRTGILEALKSMGARFVIENAREDWEPVGDIRVQSGPLKPIRITKRMIPSLIDELPILMVACALAEGRSRIQGAEELRVKETDRIHGMCTNLARLGAEVEERPDGCVIYGKKAFREGDVDSLGDHRIAMCMAVAALRAEGKVRIYGSESVSISYPGFFQDLDRLRLLTPA